MIPSWPPALAPEASARRRAHALGAGAGAGQAPAALERWVDRLCLPFDRLPFDSGALARVAPPALLFCLVVVTLAAGPPFAVLTSLGLAGGGAFLHRGAPRRRGSAIDRELPLVLEAVARHLRAGGSLAQAIDAAAPAVSGPLASSWSRMASDVGASGLVAALEGWISLGDREIRPAERLAASALALAAESGGSPARAVDGVAATLRARLAVTYEIRALSSQARSSAAVIAAAPLVFGLLAAATDDRTAAFFRSTTGLTMLAGGLALDALGAWWMACLCRSAE